jgi:7,8-dihydropterin-6-yl-methyl-4-(beta-D-ribofuranosyl)aminobenzene 5'-phosphate synthase
MRIKIIAVGSTKWERFICRWGVSFLIGEDVLFDTFGDPGVLLNNIQKFKIDTAKIKHIVLSHDDWDHIGGLWYLIPHRKDITVYICPGFKQEIKMRIASFGVKMIEAAGITQIKEGIYSTGELSGKSGERKIYEQSVVIRTAEGFALLCGCAHPGVVSIVKQARNGFQADIDLLMGGFHLKDNTDEMNRTIINDLQGLGIRRIAPMHCTGKQATAAIREAFGNGFIQTQSGSGIDI